MKAFGPSCRCRLSFLTAGLVLLTLAVGVVRAEPARVAVLDFDVENATGGNDDWTVGLADVLAVELQQRGVLLFERQQIRRVLGEQRITASGLKQWRAGAAGGIPELQYLITGRIGGSTNGQFHLETSLVEAQTGRNVASFSRAGRYPEEVAAALIGVAEQITTHLNAAGSTSVTPRVPSVRPGRPPEMNLLFYKGVAYCLAGQPEEGVGWLFEVQRLAPDFLPAHFWTMRAFEMLNLTNFVAAAREKIESTAEGQVFLRGWDRARGSSPRPLSLAVWSDVGTGPEGADFSAKLKTALAGLTNIFVADVASIRVLTGEMDLQLTEIGTRELELTRLMWSSVDVFVVLRRDEANPEGWRLECRDASTGAIWWQRGVAPNSDSLELIVGELAAQLTKQDEAAGNALWSTYQGGSVDKPTVRSNPERRREFAALLRDLAAMSGDRETWVQLASSGRWSDVRLDGRYHLAIVDQIVALTHPDDPEAAHWLSKALWSRRFWERGQERDPIPLSEAAADLLERYPESPEAHYVRSALALELINKNDYIAARPLLLGLERVLPELSQQVRISPDYWANYYFFTAVVLEKTGDSARAHEFLDRSEAVLLENPDLAVRSYGRGVWENHFPVKHPLFGPGRRLQEAVAEWQVRLGKRAAAPSPVVPPPAARPPAATIWPEVGQHLNKSREVDGAESEASFQRALQLLMAHQSEHPELYLGLLTSSDSHEWFQPPLSASGASTSHPYRNLGDVMLALPSRFRRLALQCDNPEALRNVRAQAKAVAQPLSPAVAATFFEAVGDYAEALQLVDAALREPAPHLAGWPNRYAERELHRQKVRLLQALGQTREAARYARAQIPGPHQPPLDVCWEAAAAYLAAGQPGTAVELFQDLVQVWSDGKPMDSYGASLRLCLADYLIAADELFAATEVLREVARQSEGKGLDVWLPHGHEDAYDESLLLLSAARAAAHVRSREWEWAQAQGGRRPAILLFAEEEFSDQKRDFHVLLQGWDQGNGSWVYGGAELFVCKYGRSAIPILLEAAVQDHASFEMVVSLPLLDLVAAEADAAEVLAAFRHNPYLAEAAFRLDAAGAAQVTRERFGIYARGGMVPAELRASIVRYALIDQFPVLMANLENRAYRLSGNHASELVREWDAWLAKNSTPELIEQFRETLKTLINQQMRKGKSRTLTILGETALRRGWIEGLPAFWHGEDSLGWIREYVDLPASDTEARKCLEGSLSQWRWDTAAKKFVINEGVKPDQGGKP